MIKILFFIHDLGHGGAEKVLVNLVNNLNKNLFDITLISLFGGGVNEKFLKEHIHYKCIFKKCVRGNRIILKFFSPKFLHKLFIKEFYDIEVSYLEGPCSRIISGCPNNKTKIISWIHGEQKTVKNFKKSFRSYKEACTCYNKFNQIVCVSNTVKDDFCSLLNFNNQSNAKCSVLYNTIESNIILNKSLDKIDEDLDMEKIRLVAVGSLKEVKGFDRLLHIIKKLKDNLYKVHLYILGEGPLQERYEEYININKLNDVVTLLGYKTNPYKYISKCDLFVCSSHAEGFSTAATEALVVGTPVCTVEVSGMKEMLGENNEYGIIVENNEEKLYLGIKDLLDHPNKLQYYTLKAKERGKYFSKEKTVNAVEKMFERLVCD